MAVALLAVTPSAAIAGGYLLGVDVSRFDGKIDWRKVGKSRIRFAIVQASRGSGGDCTVKPQRCGLDRFYDRNYRLAREQGIRVGPYHRAFVNGDGRGAVRRDALTEANLFLGSVGRLRPGDLLPVLDVEPPFEGLSPRELRLWLRTWLERVRKVLGARPMIYTSALAWWATGNTTKFARLGHPLWVANWEVDAPLVPAHNWAGHGWAVWQFTSSGRVYGIPGPVDKDRLLGGFANITIR